MLVWEACARTLADAVDVRGEEETESSAYTQLHTWWRPVTFPTTTTLSR
jgi:hypothetical protein